MGKHNVKDGKEDRGEGNVVLGMSVRLWFWMSCCLIFSNSHSLMGIEKKWTQPIHNWGLIMNQFILIFENRIQI